MKKTNIKHLIGKGRTAEVFLLDDKSVLKLFIKGFWKPATEYEYYAMRCINEMQVNAPLCYDYVQKDDRNGIVYEKIDGTSMLDYLLLNPKRTKFYAKQLAIEHIKIHQYHTDSLKDQYERFGEHIEYRKDKIGSQHVYLKEKLLKMDKTNVLCHGDFHPGNILINKNGCIIIDWMNCYCGSPASDVARTYLMLITPSIPDNVPERIKPRIDKLKRVTAKYYIKEYVKRSSISTDEINNWIDIIAAARFIDDFTGEEDWLHSIIEENKERLRASPSGRSALRREKKIATKTST